MFCPECGSQVERSYKFCPECGFKLSVFPQNGTQDVDTSAHQLLVTAEEKNQKEDQDVEEKTAQTKQQSTSDDLEPARATQQDPSDNFACPVTLEKGDTPSSPNLTLSVGESVSTAKLQVTDACKEEEKLSATAPECDSQPCGEAVPGSRLSVSTVLPFTTPAGYNLTEEETDKHPDICPDDSPNAVQTPADKPSEIESGLLSTSASPLTSTKEIGPTSSESSEQTLRVPCPVSEQSASEQNTDMTQSHSGRPDDKTDYSDSDQGKLPIDDLHTAREGATSHDQTENTAGQTPKNCDSVAKQFASEQDKSKTISHDTEKQVFRNKDQAAGDERCRSDDQNTKQVEYSVDPCPVPKELARDTEAVDTTQAQQPVNRDVNVSNSPVPFRPDHQTPQIDCMPVYFHAVTSKSVHFNPEKDKIYFTCKRLYGSWDQIGLQLSSRYEFFKNIFYHNPFVNSPPKKQRNNEIKLIYMLHFSVSPLIMDAVFHRPLGDKRYLVEGRVKIPKNIIHESIPYKYFILKGSDSDLQSAFETIYQKDGNENVNRCLKIREELLTREEEWHQFDDMIYLDPKKHFWTGKSLTKEVVIKGRDVAGRVMLNIILGLLETWKEPHVDNFFLLLRQFYVTYSFPTLIALHDGMLKPWGLPYGEQQVKILLQGLVQETKALSEPLHAGVVSLLIYNSYLKESLTDQLSHLCDLLCLPNKPPHHFSDWWKAFASPIDEKRVADAAEMLCNSARQHHTVKWVLVIPLIHLLRGESKPFEKVPPCDSWTCLRENNTTYFSRDSDVSVAQIMKDHAYLADIDRLLVHSWMSLLPVENLTSFISSVKVDLLDILNYLQISISSGITHSKCTALRKLGDVLIDRTKHNSKSCDDREKYGEHCLKSGAKLLGSVCRHITDPKHCDVPMVFLDIVCQILMAYSDTDSQSSDESIGETFETMREWRRKTFSNKLLCKSQFTLPTEIEVWEKLLSLSFSHEELSSVWRDTFMADFEEKLKQEEQKDQIGVYSKKMEELSKTSPLLCSAMEKCALEAVADICQDKSGRAISTLLKEHDITKFEKLMSVVVLRTWPSDVNGKDIEAEDLVLEHILNWLMSKTVFQMTGARQKLINKLSEEAQTKITLASSTFRSVANKFLSGDIQIKTLNQIVKREDVFVDLLKIDGLCDDGRCKDDGNMMTLLKLRKEEVTAVLGEKELVKDLLQICRELPAHVEVDFKGLDKKLDLNIEMMNLNEFMKVHTLDGQTSSAPGQVTYFNLCDATRQMASKLHAVKDSTIFKKCWTQQVEELSIDHRDADDTEELDGNKEIYTLDLVYSKVFQSCYSKYKGLYDGLKSGELLLEDIDSIFAYCGRKYEDLQKELDIMCKTDPSDNRKWIKRRIHQIQQYHGLHLAIESAKIIMVIRNTICPEGDFNELEKLLQMTQGDFKKNCLNYIDDDLMKTKDILMDITNDGKECLQELSWSLEFVLWVKEALEDINELKVFVDLASISAGENDQDVDRVAFFHDAVLGFSSILYGLKKDSDFEAFKESLSKLWNALKSDSNLPTKLRDTARHLEWFKTVKVSHGSVEFSSLSLATSINERGIYTIKAQDQKKLTLETSLMLEIQDGHEKNKTYTYEDLKELLNKLMLMSGRGEQNHSTVERFIEVFENVQRLTKAFVDLYAAGNPLFRYWESKIYCRTQSDPCVIMGIKFCKTMYRIQICGSLVEEVGALSKKMELFLDDWRNFMDKQRSDHYYLNYFTAEQIFYLCSVVTPANVNIEIDDKALMMLSFIQPNCTTSDVWSTWERFHKQYAPGKRINEDGQFQSHFLWQDDTNMSSANVSHLTTDDLTDNEDQTVGLKELEMLWNGYMSNEGIFFHDLLDVRSLGHLLKMMTVTENQNENKWEEPVLSDAKDSTPRRELPKRLLSNQPNLIICPHEEVLTSSICVYMTSDYEPLPSYDEVLLCTPATSNEQVELFLRRCLTPGDTGQKIYTMLWADQLTYVVSCAMEKCFQKLHSQFKHDYKLVIFCSSEREHTYIPTAFSKFKRDFVTQEPLESIQKYLSKHYTVHSDHRNAMFKGGHSVGIVTSRRAGVGKSLYVQRLYEKLEKSVEQGTAFKKCIRLTEHEVDDHKILQSLFDTPKQKDLEVFHIDVTSSVQKGLNEFIFKLFFLRYLMDSDGWVWHCSHKHLYIIELLESTSNQPRYPPGSGRKENFAFVDIFPKVYCRPPKEVMALEMRGVENADMDTDDPLMDDECFRSETYQRPFQYLTRFYNKNNLDNFTYQGIEGTHAEYLQILLIHCGIIDPSWAELRNFVWFLNLQLQDCENSDFCKVELVGDTLCGFKNFVVEFMILMSKDFATPSLCITDQSPGRQQIDNSEFNGGDLAPFLIRKRWESEPHPYIFFNDDHMSMTFIGFHLKLNDQKRVDAINPLTGEVIKQNIMTRQLYNGLKLQRVPFNRDFDQLPRADKIETLCSVLGVKWPTDPDETYELTTDNILKMMAIHMRFRCGIPVIIMGETGCGKTKLIKFMCELKRCGALAENMKLVKVHGGTTSEILHEKVKEAETLARNNTQNHKFDSVLFFDEANTTGAISSIKEILCDHSVQGQQLGSQTGLQIVAACNPYRKHTDKMIERLEASGLGYRVRAEDTDDKLGSIPLRQLVYRVHKLPPSMIPLVWDFGQLNDPTEKMYIEQMVQREVKANMIEKHYIPTITQVLSSSQKFMRERKDECSFVSLRDVERWMNVFVWFHKNHSMFATELSKFDHKRKQPDRFLPASDRVIWSLLMATGVCYQSCLEDKKSYWRAISQLLPSEYNIKRVLQEIQLMQDLLLDGVPMGKTIARNAALKENFFMMVICVELRIPLFIVGKPGSSKSLSKTLVADAMQGPASHSELYKRLKQIHLVSFQCSPHSTPDGIISTFKQCARFQKSKNLDEYISVVVLDEIGLAEDSPKMPLKTLHPLLEEGCVDDEPQPHKKVGFIGISNWALDPAKMNRGIFVSRGDLNRKELVKSAEGICSSEETVLEKIKHLFEPFAKAYITVCKEGKGFFGLRDFYSLIKMVFSITKITNKRPTADEITGAVLRNFSGKDVVDVMGIFSNELRDDFANASITTDDLVNQSISPACQVDANRYLLILTKNYAALQILQQKFSLNQIHPQIIFGSSFPKDQEYTQICRNINRVKVCMETGQTVLLLNLQNLYESLYDALNQYYVTLGGQKYVDLGLGTHRVKCRVHKNFRLIVIEEREVVYEQFPIPLINRMEKHYLDINTVLRNEQKNIAAQLKEWVDNFVSLRIQHPMKKQYDPSDVFIGYHEDTCSSVILQVTENQEADTDSQTILDKAKRILLNCATPDSVVRLDKAKLPDEEREHFIKEYVKEEMHRSLGDYIIYQTQQLEQSHFSFTEVTTFSRLLTAADIQQLQKMTNLDIRLLSLQQFDTEHSFLKIIREFLGSTPADKVLIIQTDYDEDSHRRNILSSAKYSCINEINKWATTDKTKIFVYFLTKLLRIEGGTSYVGFQGGPWRSVHIDDLRRSTEFVSDVDSLKNQRISDLFKDPPDGMETEDHTHVPQNNDSIVFGDILDTTDLIRSCVHGSVSMLRDAAESGELSTKRVENLLTLLDGSQTQGVFANIVRKHLHLLLEDYETTIPNPKSWVLREASNLNALQEGGTFLNTLWRKIQAVVTPLLANLISVIDRDCNLDLLLTECDDIRNLWLEIFASKDMLHVPYVKLESNSSVLLVQSHITAGSTMHCRMPFSWWIKDFLDGLMMQTVRHQTSSPGHFQELFINTPLGSYISKNVNKKMKKDLFERYLRDFVSMSIDVASDEELQLLCQALASCVDEVKKRQKDDNELSLSHIHIAYHFYKSRLQNLSRIISLRPDVISPLQRNQQISCCQEMVLDVHAAKACLEYLEPSTLDTEALYQHWLQQVKRVKPSLELICSQHNTRQYGGMRCKEILHDVSNGWKRIYTLALFVEHMLLGFQNDETQIQELILTHIRTLSKALLDNSDVKSVRTFEAVIQVLKSCKQGASDQIFRFGRECAVCLREPQDPTGVTK
ncbi:E3 ubiquitin-protein ligase rnf213-alpha-like isoform X2 [Acanthopagrus latus]|uniref:E3 ubiquitin-protein ligase rnf213-alpha-like isoform X2 n=1 Tax=Acanthopagrus latus TaxID=8177 RepID=UPI00187BCC3B|nr:E3 ubiquitin-protein ligase rnf213-alpha-like isoform X2 [Acanthopagrus latus]